MNFLELCFSFLLFLFCCSVFSFVPFLLFLFYYSFSVVPFLLFLFCCSDFSVVPFLLFLQEKGIVETKGISDELRCCLDPGGLFIMVYAEMIPRHCK